MTAKADAVREVSQQFQDRTNAVVEGIMAHLRHDNAKKILGPGLSPLIGRGTLRSIVTLALYADVMRVVRDMTLKDGAISNEEVDASLALLSALADAFAKTRKKDYAAFGVLSSGNARPFLNYYEDDTGFFGYANQATRWAGIKICRHIENKRQDPGPLSLFGAALSEWAQTIAASDGVSQSERSHLQSLGGFLNIPYRPGHAREEPSQPTTSHTATGAGASPLPTERAVTAPDKLTKDCPYCGETILAIALKCKHCGEMLDEPDRISSPVTPLRRLLHSANPTPPNSLTARHLISSDGQGRTLGQGQIPPPEVTFPEIKRTCNRCGNIWYSDSTEEEALQAEAQTGSVVAVLLGIGQLANGSGPAGSFTSNDSRQRISAETRARGDALSSLRRCPQCNSKSYTEIRPLDPTLKQQIPVSPQAIWGNILIGVGCLFILNGLTALGAGGGVPGLFTAVVICGIGGAIVYGGLHLRQAIRPSPGRTQLQPSGNKKRMVIGIICGVLLLVFVSLQSMMNNHNRRRQEAIDLNRNEVQRSLNRLDGLFNELERGSR